jgi:hypothetical protein
MTLRQASFAEDHDGGKVSAVSARVVEFQIELMFALVLKSHTQCVLHIVGIILLLRRKLNEHDSVVLAG